MLQNCDYDARRDGAKRSASIAMLSLSMPRVPAIFASSIVVMMGEGAIRALLRGRVASNDNGRIAARASCSPENCHDRRR